MSHLALDPTAFAAHVARQRVLNAPVGTLVLDDIADRIRTMSDRIVAEDLIFARSRAKSMIGGWQCVWVDGPDGGAFEPLAGMSDAEIERLMGVGL